MVEGDGERGDELMRQRDTLTSSCSCVAVELLFILSLTASFYLVCT